MKRTPLTRKTWMKRSSFKATPPTPRSPEEGGDPEYLEFIRALPCSTCNAPAPSHAHHSTLSGRGKGQKAPDREAMPMCWKCHGDFHTLRGPFDGWTREDLRIFQEYQVLRCQHLHSLVY